MDGSQAARSTPETTTDTPLRLRMAHEPILDAITDGARVLDVGSGGGMLTRALIELRGCEVVSVEIEEERAAAARPYATKTILGSIEDQSTWAEIGDGFDYIIFADVLEHLKYPGAVLERCREAIRPGGRVLASIPNVAYYRVRQHLLFGSFDYRPSGILDRTHLRFFTAKTVKALFRDAGYTIDSFERVYTSAKNRILGRLAPNAFTYEFVLNARCENP